METLKNLWVKHKHHIIYILVIVMLLICLGLSTSKCTNAGKEYRNNIEALKDTIKYYQDKHGNLVATKLAFESDIDYLKKLNEDLYNQIDSMKIKKKDVEKIVYVQGSIENSVQDTAYVIQHDTIVNGFDKDFQFNNAYRILEGNVNYHNDSLNVNINKDIVNFDYTVVFDKNNKIYIKSSNPYVKYQEISGFTIPRIKQKRWSLGPSISYGYDPFNNRTGATIGVSLNYGIIKW